MEIALAREKIFNQRYKNETMQHFRFINIEAPFAYREIATAIQNGETAIKTHSGEPQSEIDFTTVNLPNPQITGTSRQYQSYAESKARQIIANLKSNG